MSYKPTIGLEIHVELKTQTKMFCDCLNDENELISNKNVCPICIGHPGTLPKANQGAIEAVIKTGLALNCEINRFSKFDRKNYFYPDLPKAYQISQYDKPLCVGGFLVLPSSGKKIRITRIHLEEDTAKLAHAADGKHSLVDFNRAGVPLMELVTEPDFTDPADVMEFAQELQLIVRYMDVSNADMEKGNMRLEANISVAPEGSKTLGTKVEVKNLNSFRSVGRACEYEIARQSEALEKGESIHQETRGWDEDNQKTFSQRSKESAHDYRYFPDPDLPPLTFTDEYIEGLRAQVAELPQAKRERFESEYNLSPTGTAILIEGRPVFGSFFEEAMSELKEISSATGSAIIFNYLTSDVKGLEMDRGKTLEESKLKPVHLAEIAAALEEGKISSRVAKNILAESFDTGKLPSVIIEEKGLVQVSDESELGAVVQEVIDSNEKVWNDYKNGKEAALQFLVGKVMAITKGAANPEVIRELFIKRK